MVQLRLECEPAVVRSVPGIALRPGPVHCGNIGHVRDVRVQTLRESAVLFRQLSWRSTRAKHGSVHLVSRWRARGCFASKSR